MIWWRRQRRCWSWYLYIYIFQNICICQPEYLYIPARILKWCCLESGCNVDGNVKFYNNNKKRFLFQNIFSKNRLCGVFVHFRNFATIKIMQGYTFTHQQIYTTSCFQGFNIHFLFGSFFPTESLVELDWSAFFQFFKVFGWHCFVHILRTRWERYKLQHDCVWLCGRICSPVPVQI